MIEKKAVDSDAAKQLQTDLNKLLIEQRTNFLPDDLEDKINTVIYSAMVYQQG